MTRLSKAIVAVCLAAAPLSAAADVIRFDFTGSVYSISNTAITSVSVGDTFDAYAIVDTAAITGGGSGSVGGYSALDEFSLTLNTGSGPLTYAATDGDVVIWDDNSGSDGIFISDFVSGPTIDGQVPFTLQFGMTVPVGTYDAFTGLDWPGLSAIEDMIPYRNPEYNVSFLAFTGRGNNIRFEMDSYAATVLPSSTPAIPLPAGLPLLAGALGAFGLVRRKRA